MIPIQGLFETHLTVRDLNRSVAFYGEILNFSLAARFDDRRCVFYWIGPNHDAMIGLWEVGIVPWTEWKTRPAAAVRLANDDDQAGG